MLMTVGHFIAWGCQSSSFHRFKVAGAFNAIFHMGFKHGGSAIMRIPFQGSSSSTLQETNERRYNKGDAAYQSSHETKHYPHTDT
jgi:hypothetical protein